MDIILIPGFWLDASSWAEVTPALVEAGHNVHPLTLPGLESAHSSRAGIGLRTHIDAVVEVIDTFDEPVVLVGHSGGGAIAYGAADARPDRVARIVYVDSGPLAHGSAINPGLATDSDDVPLPAWDDLEEDDLTDLSNELRERFIAIAIPEPRGVVADLQELSDEKRFDVPATIIACEFPSSQLQEWIEQDHPYVAELAGANDVEFVDLPTGHWPQFTRPVELGEVILAAVDRTAQKEYAPL